MLPQRLKKKGVSLPAWETPHITRDPVSSYFTKYRPLVDIANVINDITDTNRFVAESISVLPFGKNLMTDVSYSNSGGGSRLTTMPNIQASVPIKLDAVRPPIYRLENREPLSRGRHKDYTVTSTPGSTLISSLFNASDFVDLGKVKTSLKPSLTISARSSAPHFSIQLPEQVFVKNAISDVKILTFADTSKHVNISNTHDAHAAHAPKLKSLQQYSTNSVPSLKDSINNKNTNINNEIKEFLVIPASTISNNPSVYVHTARDTNQLHNTHDKLNTKGSTNSSNPTFQSTFETNNEMINNTKIKQNTGAVTNTNNPYVNVNNISANFDTNKTKMNVQVNSSVNNPQVNVQNFTNISSLANINEKMVNISAITNPNNPSVDVYNERNTIQKGNTKDILNVGNLSSNFGIVLYNKENGNYSQVNANIKDKVNIATQAAIGGTVDLIRDDGTPFKLKDYKVKVVRSNAGRDLISLQINSNDETTIHLNKNTPLYAVNSSISGYTVDNSNLDLSTSSLIDVKPKSSAQTSIAFTSGLIEPHNSAQLMPKLTSYGHTENIGFVPNANTSTNDRSHTFVGRENKNHIQKGMNTGNNGRDQLTRYY